MRTSVLLPVFLLVPVFAAADTIRVRADGSGDVPEIADALLIASPGDVISLEAGTYFEHDLVWKSGVRLVGVFGDPTAAVIDAQGRGRCLDASGTGATTAFRHVTFANGSTTGDGGLVNAAGSLAEFRSCVFRNGSAVRGGAIFVSSADLDGCEFLGNSATRGGAVFCLKAGTEPAPTLSRCVFEENTAEASGGAVHSEGAQRSADGLYVLGSRFRGNSARDGGAARLHEYDAVHGCRFLDNVATASGGALYLVASAPNGRVEGIQKSVFARNAAAFGGGIAVEDGSPIPNVVFVSNTMVENHAPTGAHIGFLGRGGGFFWRSILAFGHGGTAVAGSWPLGVACFDVFGNAGGDWVGPLGGQSGADGNFSDDPRFHGEGTDEFLLAEDSPCRATSSPGCGEGIGAPGESLEPVLPRVAWASGEGSSH